MSGFSESNPKRIAYNGKFWFYTFPGCGVKRADGQIVHEELEAIWRDAWLALRHADEIYIIGYSLPPEDLHARLTIRSSIRANERAEGHRLKIAIINPDRNVYLRFSRLVEGSVKYYESGLQGISLDEMVGSV